MADIPLLGWAVKLSTGCCRNSPYGEALQTLSLGWWVMGNMSLRVGVFLPGIPRIDPLLSMAQMSPDIFQREIEQSVF